MHHLLLVTKSANCCDSAEEARSDIFSELQNDPSFCGEGGRFSSPICDWFVIGGRWSGHLQETDDYNYYEEAKKLLDKNDKNDFISMNDIENEDNRKLFQKDWEAHGKIGLHPYCRSTYEYDGYEDDCMLITPELYNKFLKEFEGENIHYDEFEDPVFIDTDYDKVSPDFIGKKYICVVDYHN
jgi:hypothetical protein